MKDPLMFSWDDLRIIKAIGQAGALAPAAAALGVNATTIARRLDQAETILGVTLFDRRRTGYRPTAAGAQMIALADRIEPEIVNAVRSVAGHDQGHAGDLRVTTSDALLVDFLNPIIASFQARNPLIRVDVTVVNEPLNLARGESDIAFRATAAPPENLFGRRVGTIAWAPYGNRADFLGGWPSADDLYRLKWASYGPGLSGLKAHAFVEKHVLHDNIVYRGNSVAGVASAIASGIGVGFLPCMHGDLWPNITRIGPLVPDLSDELWVLTHPSIKKSSRVSAFMAHCITAIGKQRRFIEGRDGHAERAGAR